MRGDSTETNMISMFPAPLLFISSNLKSNIFFIPRQKTIFWRYQIISDRLQSGFSSLWTFSLIMRKRESPPFSDYLDFH
ncbi:hypothetical protein V6x_39730 [Gimesia chilikensis]|uniref:Uncharacterized protein n=1 Tax=Gimesia chilikensis TaxID=2605989 RepID=A0A517WG65_9PLAN|nr:hypothetical protein V6x_39730 [Gimesia chilikensis]